MTDHPASVSDEDLLQLFSDAAEKTLSTTEVREEIGYSRSGAYGRLDSLAKAGYLLPWQTGPGNATIWTLTDAGRDYLEGELDASDLEDNNA